MNLLILEKFKGWFVEQQPNLQQAGLSVTFHQGMPTAKTGAYLHIETERVFAAVYLWQSGELEVEALKIEDSERIIWEYHHLQEWEEILPLISSFLNKLITHEYN